MTVDHHLEPDVLAMLHPLWDYLAVCDPATSADVIFVFGSRDLAVPARAAELYHEGYASQVLVTGSYGRMTRGVFPKPEALVFKDLLVESGVPEAAVVTDIEAANTLENVRFGMAAMRRSGMTPRTALLVAKGFVMRRCVATFARQFGDVRVRACPPTGGMEAALDRSGVAFATRLVAEVDRLDHYAKKGDIRPQEVPARIREAARNVRELTS